MPVKPTETEEEYFAKIEFEKRKKQEGEKQAQLIEEAKKNLKELHYMHCPKCGMQLIEIDYRKLLWINVLPAKGMAGCRRTGGCV